MVIHLPTRTSPQRGALLAELLVAMALLLVVFIPVAGSIATEKRLARASYQRAIAMEIVDGEMEILLAGEWRSFAPGTQEYQARAGAATNLPPGQLILSLDGRSVRLEWRPAVKQHGGKVVRQAPLTGLAAPKPASP